MQCWRWLLSCHCPMIRGACLMIFYKFKHMVPLKKLKHINLSLKIGHDGFKVDTGAWTQGCWCQSTLRLWFKEAASSNKLSDAYLLWRDSEREEKVFVLSDVSASFLQHIFRTHALSPVLLDIEGYDPDDPPADQRRNASSICYMFVRYWFPKRRCSGNFWANHWPWLSSGSLLLAVNLSIQHHNECWPFSRLHSLRLRNYSITCEGNWNCPKCLGTKYYY